VLRSLKGGRGTSTKSSRVETVSLASCIDEEIDFLNLDVEGMEVGKIIENLAMAGSFTSFASSGTSTTIILSRMMMRSPAS
jgi:hypothetical protein